MALPTLISLMALCLLCFPSSQLSLAAKTISSLPLPLPLPPPSSSPTPASSPDITPLFPTPSKGDISPSEASLPIIPSSPSPPNPDDMPTFGPNTMTNISPSGSLPASGSWTFGASMMLACLFYYGGHVN
ncbi:classical arabinogalactan protein 26-like [Bidens hawaiensis]|uniref:classical arabinogalactan protein 26-like n=1 Tax=Bidens hawaiensis TaxID=980011 RepID=UPI00404AD4D8